MKNRKGFTLIEAVFTIMVLAFGLTGVMTLYHRTVSSHAESETLLIAEHLAASQIEQMLQDKEYNGYASLNAVNYPASQNLAALGYPGYTRTINILEVDSDDLVTVRNNSGYKRVTVSVAGGGSAAVSLVTLMTAWGVAP